jgi:predicted TPR repeat methyltransferase
MTTDWFAGRVAETYDDDRETASPEAVEPVVDFLAPLAAGGALELAIGTGRIAVPLAARGVPVCGIELSQDMVVQLRRKGRTSRSRSATWRRRASRSASRSSTSSTTRSAT